VVDDTGCGSPRNAGPDFSSPFSPPGQTLAARGLGLTVVKSIVDEHGGTITVLSEKNIGTRFTVHFPVAGAARVKGFVA